MALVNQRTGEIVARRVALCDTFWKRACGLMFRRRLAADQVYLFVESRQSVTLTAIHTFFVFFPIAVLWLNQERRVVDMVLARPFHPHYAPSGPARYFIEGSPSLLEKAHIGDVMDWEVK